MKGILDRLALIAVFFALSGLLARVTALKTGSDGQTRDLSFEGTAGVPLLLIVLAGIIVGWLLYRWNPPTVKARPAPPTARPASPTLPPASPLLFPTDVDVVPPPRDSSWTQVDPGWSLDALLRDFNPHESWRGWFAEAYSKAIEADRLEERFAGWKAAAMIFGDMHAPVFCLFVCLHGRSLRPQEANRFDAHIDLCLRDLGLATSTRTGTRSIPMTDFGEREMFHRDEAAAVAWLGEQLRPFGGSVKQGAIFAMRLTASRFGLLRGPSEPSIGEVLDESLWERAE